MTAGDVRAPRVGIVDSGCAPGQMPAVLAARGFILDGDAVQLQDATPDQLGHGSAIAAVVRHLAPTAQLLIAQVFHARFTTTAVQVATAVDWLVGEGAELINLSLGLRADRSVLRDACERATAAGVLVCAASPARGQPVFPSAYPGVLRMTGDARCARGEWSWLGTQHADFGAHVAPLPGDAAGSGASLGCAHLSGHVAGMLSDGSVGSPQAVVQALMDGACYRGPERKTEA